MTTTPRILTTNQMDNLLDKYGCFEFGDAQGDKRRGFAADVLHEYFQICSEAMAIVKDSNTTPRELLIAYRASREIIETLEQEIELLKAKPVIQEPMVNANMLAAGKKALHASNGRGALEKCQRIFVAMLAAQEEDNAKAI